MRTEGTKCNPMISEVYWIVPDREAVAGAE